MKKIFLLALITLSILAAMLMISPPGILDSRFFYSSEIATSFIRGLSAEDANRYLISEVLDLFFILGYSSTLWAIFQRSYLPKAVALVPGALDIIESVPIVLCLMGIVPIESLPFLGMLTFMKWSSVGLVVLYVLIKRRAAVRD